MNILIIGNGGRECAIATSLRKNNSDLSIYYFGGFEIPDWTLFVTLFVNMINP